MASTEPSEEAIENFVNFTSTSRDNAISFLKGYNLDSQKAINAYFEDPTPPQQFSQEADFYSDQGASSWVEHAEGKPGPSYPAPPSRPPSRMNIHNTGDSSKHEQTFGSNATVASGERLTLAEREECELQQAMAMSLNQDLGQQETGIITDKSSSNFGKATRDHYEENEWAITLFNSSSREIIISPDPEDRQRLPDEPAFLRPCQDFLYLGGLLTILHSIPLAREALLLRNWILPDYGNDPQWWNGQPISVPKIVNIEDAQEDQTDWDEILYETQRLMAFLDDTTRAFGSCDALASLKALSSFDSEGTIGGFLEAWQEAAVRATPENELAAVFSSRAFKRPLAVDDTPIDKEFFTLEPFVELEHGQTLYDVLDSAMWSDRAGEELDDVWLGRVADILTIKLECSQFMAAPVDVKIPAVFYADRYVDKNRDVAREFRSERLEIYTQISKLERLANRFNLSRSIVNKKLTSKEIIEKASAAVTLALPKSLANGETEAPITPEIAYTEAQRLADELRAISGKVEEKLKELEERRQSAIQSLRIYSRILTEPSPVAGKPPFCKYTLRGVCTEPHVTYVLRRVSKNFDAQEQDTREDDDWQWWRISFSADDARTRQSERANHSTPYNADVVGYTAQKVREIEVLQAARDESKSVLLVYANSGAVNAPQQPLPVQLQEFVHKDNQSFNTEILQSQKGTGFEQARSQELKNWEEETPIGSSTAPNDDDPHDTQPRSVDGDSLPQVERQGVEPAASCKEVNVFDFEVPSFEEDHKSVKEMTEKPGPGLLRPTTQGAEVQHSMDTVE